MSEEAELRSLYEDAKKAGRTDLQEKIITRLEQMKSAPQKAAPVPVQQPQPLPKGNPIDYVMEPANAVAGAALGAVTSGWGGLLTAPAIGTKDAVGFMDETNKRFQEGFAPTTQMGQEGLKDFGSAVGWVADKARHIPAGLSALGTLAMGGDLNAAVDNRNWWLNPDTNARQELGNRVLDKTNSPLAAALAFSAPEILGGGVATKQLYNRAIVDPRYRSSLAVYRGDESRNLAPYNVRVINKDAAIPEQQKRLGYNPERGDTLRIEKDPNYKPLVKAGFEPGALRGIKVGATSSPETKAAQLRMLGIKRKGIENPTWAMDNQPLDVAGKTIDDRVKFVVQKNKEAGRMLDEEIAKLKGVDVDYVNPANQFQAGLAKLDVRLDTQGLSQRIQSGMPIDKAVKESIDFSDSVFAKTPAAQKTISDVIELMAKGEGPDAYRAHVLKRQLDNMIDYEKQTTGISADAENLILSLRRNLNKSLGDASDGYRAANEQYSDTINVINNIQKDTPKRIDVRNDPNAYKALGLQSRKLASNYAQGGVLDNDFNELLTIAEKYGAKGGADIKSLVQLDAQLKRLGTAGKENSLEGIFNRAASAGTVKEGAKAVKDAYRGFLTPDEEEAFRLLDQMIRSQ